ncbi:MAG: YitT family protein [Oscillospiraceae bacterium]|nr:YitT family protein [Oscillospiraceae bacterium]
MVSIKKEGKTLLLIILGSLVYAVATQLFIFSNSLFLGGTSGVSVILNHFLPGISSGEFLMGINIGLMLLAVILLGKGMAVKTFLGSTFTTVFIGMLDKIFSGTGPLIANPVLSAVIGAGIVAAGSALLFYVDSSSGGTDIIALIIRKYSDIHIGRALLAADVAIVVVGACISEPLIAVASVIGLLIKTFGIDFIIAAIRKTRKS